MTQNALAIAGVACLVRAGSLVHPALAWLVAGLALLAVAIGDLAPAPDEAIL